MTEQTTDAAGTVPATTTAPSAAPEGGEASGVDFGDLAVHDELATPDSTPSGEGVAAAEPAPTASPAAAPSASPPVPQAGTASPTPPLSPPPEPTPPQPAATAPVEPTAPAPAEQMTFEQHRAKFLPELSKLYELSEAEVEEFQANPGTALPKLAAQLHYEVQVATYQSVMQALPQLVNAAIAANKQGADDSQKFLDAWPKLKSHLVTKPQDEAVVEQVIRAYRAVNPKADKDTVIKAAGLIAMMHLGIPLDVPGAGNGTMPTTPPAGAVPQPSVRPPGVASVGHVVRRPAPGTEEPQNLIEDLVNSYEAGEI